MNAHRSVASGLALLVWFLTATFLRAAGDERLLNLSTRAQVGSGDNALIAGFVIGEGTSKQVLIRAVGPSLGQFGLGSLLSNPKVELFDSEGRKMVENNDWKSGAAGSAVSAADFQSVGAFAFSSERDAALLVQLPSGAYTVRVSDETGGTGVALVEVYDVSGTARLINLSTRARVDTGAQIVISGLVVAPGTDPRRVLVRAVGPSLSAFGVGGVLSDPRFSIVDSRGIEVASNDNWADGGAAASVASAAAQGGAFALTDTTSKDSAAVVQLNPGSYTILVTGTGNSSGVALVELYDLTVAGRPTVSVGSLIQPNTTDQDIFGYFVFSRTGSTESPMIVRFTVEGTAIPGIDFAVLPDSITIPAGAAQATLEVKLAGVSRSQSVGSSTAASTKTLIINLVPDSSYSVGTRSAAAIVVPDALAPTPSPTPTPTAVPTPTPTLRPTPVVTPTPSPTATPTPTLVPTATPTPTPSPTPSPTPEPTPSPTPTPTATPVPTPTPSPIPTATPTPSPAPTATPTPSPTPTAVPTPTATPAPTPTPVPTATPTPTPVATPTPSPVPTARPTPTTAPTPTPTATPTTRPTTAPTPTVAPTTPPANPTPTPRPTATPTPSPRPTPTPTPRPTATPTPSPTPTPLNVSVIGVTATTANITSTGGTPLVFTFTRTGPSANAVTFDFTLQGTAVSGIDYVSPSPSITIPAGETTATLSITAYSTLVATATSKTVILVLNPSSSQAYLLAGNTTGTGTIQYEGGLLYASSLRVPATASGSTASGAASLQVSGDGTFGIVNVNFAGLSSTQTVAYLRLGDKNQVGVELVRLPSGQVNGQRWNINPSGTLTRADILQAIQDGRVFVSIQTVSNPGGELVGSFVRSTGSVAFVAPDPAPSLPSGPLTATEVSRFLNQATFGPTKGEIDALTGSPRTALDTWITNQMSASGSSHVTAMNADFDTYLRSDTNTAVGNASRNYAWWKIAVNGNDQLRQRVAFALSQIFVVSENNETLANTPISLGVFYDLLSQNAFGNYRNLLEQVSLSPAMGTYLSHLRNAKATFNSQGVQTTFPDENYAREIMQLFSIGLNQLHPDGSLILTPSGAPLPVYDQTTIGETAKVFTGWGFGSLSTNPSFYGAAADYSRPMMLYSTYHDNTAKTIVGGVRLAANQGGLKDLQDTLDTLFLHPNTGPFVSRQLIQRLVTSNPSPGYVYRVAQVFANNGSGTRGDLGAVVRAILLDYEARSETATTANSFGKLREPLLRGTALLRSLGGGSNSGRIAISSGTTDSSLAQTALKAPTVFNFFEPDYVQPGVLAEAGLHAPEFQILNDNTAITVPNFLRSYLYSTRPAATDTTSQTVGITFDATMLALAQTPQSLVDYLNLVLAGNKLPTATVNRIVTAVTALPAATSDANRLERVRSAIYLVMTTPNGAIQR